MQSQTQVRGVRAEAPSDYEPLRSRIIQIRSFQAEQGGEACFLSNKRFFCDNLGCEWRKECCRLVAAWKR